MAYLVKGTALRGFSSLVSALASCISFAPLLEYDSRQCARRQIYEWLARNFDQPRLGHWA
eukprot:2220763-Karenia_brevis.AAC.1